MAINILIYEFDPKNEIQIIENLRTLNLIMRQY